MTINLQNFKKGVLFALLTALISGFAIFTSKISVTVIKDAVAFTTLKNLIVAFILLSFISYSGELKQISKLKLRDKLLLLGIGIVGGSLPFALFFKGLTLTSAINAAFIHKTLFLWVAILAPIFLKERLNKSLLVIALTILLGANVLLRGNSQLQFNTGELMVFLATLLWAVENIIAKVALRSISPNIVASARMTIGSLILLAVVAVQGNLKLLFSIYPNQLIWVIIPCVFLTSYVLSWYRALKFAPATVVSAVLVVSTPITDLLSALFITKNFTIVQVASAGLIILGLAIIVLSFIKQATVPPRKATVVP